MAKNVVALAGLFCFCYTIVMLTLIIASFRKERSNLSENENVRTASTNVPSTCPQRRHEVLLHETAVTIEIDDEPIDDYIIEQQSDLPPSYESCPSYEEYSRNIEENKLKAKATNVFNQVAK